MVGALLTPELHVSGLMFLASLNIVLRRLGAILPDEGLHHETRQFTTLNLNLLLVMMVLAGVSLWQVRGLLEAADWVDHTDRVIAQTQATQRQGTGPGK